MNDANSQSLRLKEENLNMGKDGSCERKRMDGSKDHKAWKKIKEIKGEIKYK